MTIQFNQIPANLRVPFVWFEINAGSSPYQAIARLLLIGQKTSAGTAAANTPVIVTGGEDGLFGKGSMLSAMYKTARANAPFQEIWALPLADAVGASAATGTIAIEGAFLKQGDSIILYVGDIRVVVPVTVLMSNADIANALVAAINVCIGMQVTASIGVVGAKATNTATITGPASAAGTATVTIGGVAYVAQVANSDTATVIAGNLVAAINAAPTAPVIASNLAGVITLTSKVSGTGPNAITLAASAAATGVGASVGGATFAGGTRDTVTLTANNKGTLGNSIRIETALYQTDGKLADNILTITQLSGGAGDPTGSTGLVAALAALGDDEFDWIAQPYNDSASISTVQGVLDGRWGPMSSAYGHAITVGEGTPGTLLSQMSTFNSPRISFLGAYHTPAPSYLWTAAVAAQAAVHLQAPPELSRPLQTLPLVGLRAPKLVADRWTVVQRQSFYYGGVGGYFVERDGTVVIDRLTTTYQTDAWGSPDQTWLDVNTIAQVMFGVRYLKAKVTSTYPRNALVDKNPNNLQGFVTADDIKTTLIHGYSELVGLGVFENADLFAQLLEVARNAQNANRIDAYLPLDHVNQLRILAANATSYLQYPANP